MPNDLNIFKYAKISNLLTGLHQVCLFLDWDVRFTGKTNVKQNTISRINHLSSPGFVGGIKNFSKISICK